jgi:glycosyltransferase involved in cell wall biosynthesis
VTVRVLHVLEAIEGGTARHLVDIVEHAHGIDHEVAIPAERVGGLTDSTARGRIDAAGAVVHEVAMQRTPWVPANARALASLVRLIRARRPDIVHTHSSIGGLLGRVAAAAGRTPCLYTPNGITQVRAGQWVERALRPLTRRFVAVSTSEGALALTLRLARPDRVVVIPNGIEMATPPPIGLRAQLGIDDATLLVGTIARLVPQKAPEDFVAACALVAGAVPAARFVLIGGGTLAAEVDAAVIEAGLGARFTRLDGLVGAAAALGELDVFALPSRFEGGPYAPLEAMRAGTPVVLSDAVGNRDVVEPGVSGLLVPVGHPEAMAAAIVELLLDDGRREAMARAGEQRVRALFDVRQMGQRLAELYAEVAQPAGPS